MKVTASLIERWEEQQGSLNQYMCSGFVKFSEVYGRMAARYGGNYMIYCNVYEWLERQKGVLTGECDAHFVWPYDLRVKEQTYIVRDSALRL
jgi:hypothetical protein